jgi:hypothetical protein
MNPDKLQAEIGAILPQSSTGVQKQPLHILDNQVEPHEQQHSQFKTDTVSQKPIRTYESDVAEALARKKSSVMNMVIAENKRDTGSESISNKPPSQAGKKLLLLVISMIFVGAGLFGAYYLYLQSPLVPDEPAQPAVKIQSVVTPDAQKVLAVNSLQGKQLSTYLVSEFVKYEVAPGAILEFIPVTATGSTTLRVTGTDFVNSLGLDIPDILERSITDRWMLGVHNTAEVYAPFMIYTTDFFQNAFAGMLRWEESMPEELADLLNYRERARPEDSTSTTSISSFFNIRGTFEDRIIRNRDVRQFISQRGEMLFLYAFLDEKTIVIATAESTITNLLDRIEKQTFVR